MSKLSSQFAAISPGMDVNQATDGLVSTMKAFDIDVSEVLDGIMSKINIIGNTAATSNSEIVDMITRSSAAMAEANNTLEQTIALETAAVEITRNAENVGTMFKTLSMRIRGYDEEGEQLEDYEELKGKIADLTKTADNPGGISLFTDANKTEYKSTYQVLKDIHEIYDDLTDKQQAGLLEALGGKRGGQIIGSVMRNWNAVDKAMQNMEKSAGSADAEMGIVEQSITFKMNRLKETWVGVLQGLVDRGDLGKGIDLLTKFSDGIGKVIDELGLFKTAILAISGAELIKRFDVFTKIPEMFKAFSKGDFSAITTPLQELNDLGKSVKESAEIAKRLKDLKSFLSESSTEGEDGSQVIDMIDYINGYREAIEGLNLEQAAAVLSAQGLNEQEALSVLTYNEGTLAATAMSEAEAQAIITKMGLVETGEALTAEQLAQITTSGILEKQIDKEILGALGLTLAEDGQLVATKTLNVEKAKELILTSDLTVADKQLLLGILGVTAAEKTQIGVTNVLRGAFTKLWATISAHPLIALATALAAVCVGIVTYTKKVKEARAETAKTAKADWEAANKTYRESAETFEDLSKRYVELSKGVDSLGHNVKLTTDEYDEYRETVNKIAELSPDLVQGWNDQNDAILKTRDSVELLGKAYDLTMQKANWQIISQANDIFKNSLDELQEFEEDAPGASVEKIERTRRLNDYLNGQLPTFDLSGTDLGSVWTNESSYLESLMKQLGIKDSKGNDFKRMGAWEDPQKYTQYVQTFFADLSEAERNAIQGYIRGRESQYAQVFEGRRDVFKAIVSDEIIANKQLSSDMKNVLMSWSDTLDADTLAGFDRYTDMYSYIVGVFDQLKGVDQETLELGLTMNTDFNNGDITYGEYQARIQAMISLINQLFPDNQDIQRSFRILFGIEEEGEDFGGIDDQVEVIKNKLGYDRTESRHLTDEAKARNKEINEFINGLHPDEADLLLSGEIEIDENTSIKNLKETLDKMKEEAAKNPIEVKTSEFVEDLKKMEDDWQTLSTAYDASTTSGKTISATDLQSVTDKFGGIGQNAETGMWNAMSESLENYNEKLVENPGNVEIAKTANNELATSYLDLSGTLEKLIDEDSEYAKETLKQQRVENYEEVVQSRLSVKYKATRKNLEDLAETVAEYSDALSKSDKTAEDFSPDGQFSHITEQVANLIGEYDEETGKLLNPANIDGQFMADNWGLVEDAITGVDGAVDQLYVKLAEANAKKILVEAGLDDSQLQAEMSNISDMLAIASNWTMEPEALLDNSQFMSALAACYDGTQSSVDAINAALGTIGMKIQYKTTPRKITVPKAQATNGTAIPTADAAKGANGGQTMAYWTTEQITVDDFEIVSTKTGKGTVGSGARIGAPVNNNSPGGGNGKDGGGDGSDKDFEQSYDWIEVTIQRIEEEIARLEERVGNAYDVWINRNKALVEEMKKTSDEIKVQSDAAGYYLAEADKVQLDETYKKRVREGDTFIEPVTDEELSKNIEKYREAYEKYVKANDAVQTLTIKMGDLSKEYFDQTKEQYQEQIDLIQHYADLVDERINRTQEKGYFVSKKYYEQLIWFGDENVKQMRSQLDALIKKRDEAVSAGNIKYGSSAWNEMNNEILEVAKSIESATTELVNYRNEMRQLEWDRFDFRMNYIDQLTQEAEFLVDLLDNQKLYEDTGRFNNRGWADAALHASEFNVQMQKALYYATERTKVEQESAKDPANKDLIERRQELLKLQQESITAAYAEKDAIKSLVEEGINIHLDALQKLIDEYKESLSNAKD